MITKEFQARIKRVGSTDVDAVVSVTLSYDADTDPFAVEAVFSTPGEGDSTDVTWYFSRDLLSQGSRSLVPCGSGDVKFRLFPEQEVIMVCLRSPGGHADVALPEQEIVDFLSETAGDAQVPDQRVDSLVDEFLKEVFEA